MGHYHRFKRGDLVVIVSGRYEGHQGVVDSAVFQRTVDYP
jgi:ribosomal protein L24